MLTSIYDDNFLLYTPICFMGQQVVFNYLMISPEVPTTLMTSYSYPMDHHCHSFVSKNGWKWLKNNFLMKLTSLTSYSTHKYVVSDNEWCSVIIWFYPRCLLHLRPYIVTLWATIATQLRAKTVEKHVFYNAYHCKLLFYSQICPMAMGQWVVFSYPMVSPKVLTTLMTPYSYPIGNHSHSFVSKNGRK
jgi:hypothetical protein